MTHAAEKFDWGTIYYRGIALGFDEGYAAYRADRAKQRWLRSRQGGCPSGTTSEQVVIASKDNSCESPALLPVSEFGDGENMVEVHMGPMSFPNFLRVKEWDPERYTFPVAHLSPEQAAAYWDEMKPLWLEHVAKRRQAWKDAGSPKLAALSKSTAEHL